MEPCSDFIDIGVLAKPGLLGCTISKDSNAEEPIEFSKRVYLIAVHEAPFKGFKVGQVLLRAEDYYIINIEEDN